MKIKSVRHLNGEVKDLEFPGEPQEIDGSKLLALPALIDPHVHFRVPGGEYKEDWKSGALAAVTSGVTTVCDMPNNTPPCTTLERLEAKKAQINAQLKSVGLPLRYGLYFGADQGHFSEIPKVANSCVALKIFMGCSTGGLVVDTDSALEEAFQIAAESKMLVAVHAEDEALLQKKRAEFRGNRRSVTHSLVRPREAAILATEKAISLARKYGASLYILHISTKEELRLIRQAKADGVRVFGETTPHHLLFSMEDYKTLGTLIQMNPPIREKEDQEALWEALRDGTLDTIGTDHAPHTLEEKKLPYGEAPSGIPGIETLLPLLLDAAAKGRITLERIVELTRKNPEKILSLPSNEDLVLVDLEMRQEVEADRIKSKCGWTPYAGRVLQGWPIYTILEGKVIRASGLTPKKLVGRSLREGYRNEERDSGFAKS
ncbi:MAG: Dihydroorotase [Chlamydiae bacterium]|nr:Dihydroorotase [Chlamydiota bacterium]